LYQQEAYRRGRPLNILSIFAWFIGAGGYAICYIECVASLCMTLFLMGTVALYRICCRISSLLQGSFAKETYDFKEPTSRSHPPVYIAMCYPHMDALFCRILSLL